MRGGFLICAIKSAQHETYAVKLREDIESLGDVEEMHCCIASLTYSWQVNYT